MSVTKYIAAASLVVVAVHSGAARDNETVSSDTGPPPEGPWSAALEDWVTAERVVSGRHGRIMVLPPSQGYYVSDRIDLVPPPPPQHSMYHRGPYPAGPPGPHRGPGSLPSGPPRGPHRGPGAPPSSPPISYYESESFPPAGPHDPRPHMQVSATPPAPAPAPTPGPSFEPPIDSASMPYDEWQRTPPPPPGVGKIINRPPNPYKDQFKPSYPPPSRPAPGGVDRADEPGPAPAPAPAPAPPRRQVSETDLYLLGAIEKLVYRVDLMEKRLRKMEENVHYLVAGVDAKPEPCASNFTRIGNECYFLSSEALNWKNANYACRKLKANLVEFSDEQKRHFINGLLADNNLKGYDFWTGGLNPGLLWIWSHSAKAVMNSTESGQSSATILGEGRCLALVADPGGATFRYGGHDCSLRHRFACRRDEDRASLGNEIERVARKVRERKERKERKPKIVWNDDEPSTIR